MHYQMHGHLGQVCGRQGSRWEDGELVFLPTKMALWSGHLCQSMQRKDPGLGKNVENLLG